MKGAGWLAGLVVAAAAAGVTAVAGAPLLSALRAEQQLATRVASAQGPGPVPVRPCAEDHATPAAAPLVLLVLGQSNAGNHGANKPAEVALGSPKANVFVGSGCQFTADPLPGGTGEHGSIWSRLPSHLHSLGLARPVVVALLAVDATSMKEWSSTSGPLAARLDALLAQLKLAQLQPELVLWQQGEADALAGTAQADYAHGLERLRAHLRTAGVAAPILAARSTLCQGSDGTAVRAAISQVVARHPDMRLGPDTDALQGPYRHRECHFSTLGLDAAARMWAQAIGQQTH